MAAILDQDFGSESEEDFNPEPEIDEDDVDGRGEGQKSSRRRHEQDDEDEEEEEVQSSRKAGRRNVPDEDDDDEDGGHGADRNNDAEEDGDEDPRGAEDEDEEDEEDEEEDEDEDEEVQRAGHRRKRRKKDARMQFIEMEAEVDDEDEDEGDEDEELPEETHPDDLLDLPPGAERDDRRHRELDRQRELAASMDAEKQAAAYKERYGRTRTSAVDSVVVPQRLLLPSVSDPTIWGIRVKPGKEMEVVYAITKRYDERKNSTAPLGICSAFERGGTMTGYVYVEARKQADVMEACENISFCYPRTNMVLIPINEMPDLLRVTKSKELEPGMYVRMKRPPLYAGDLAEVIGVEQNGLDVTVRIVPRLDYGLNEDTNGPAQAQKRNRFGKPIFMGPRPAQRLFNEAEAKKKHMKYLSSNSVLGKRAWTYRNETYEDGYLIKDVKINWLQAEDVNPSLEEVTKFATGAEDGTDSLDLAALAATLKSNTSGAAYLPGDMVEIYQGEQQGVCGKAISVHGDIVTLEVMEGYLKGQTIEAPVKTLRKKFKEGDHVKVIGGSKYHDEVGLVIKTKDDRVTLLTDSTNQEITVFSKDLRAASASTNLPGVSKYDLYDLVQLDAATVACVIRVDRESLQVLDQTGSVRTLLPSQVSSKLDKRKNAVATDRDGSEIRHEDTVKEHGGEGRQGRVLHIHRNFLFVQNRQQAENAGVFVVRSTNVTTVAAKGGRVTNAGPDLTKMNPALQRNGNGTGAMAMPPPRTIGKDRLIGKTVIVRKGPHKGLLGIVKDTTDTAARVELHTKSKTITVPKDTLTVKDPITGNSVDFSKFGGTRPKQGGAMQGRFSGNAPGQSAWSGGRTPAVNAGAATPAWGGGSKTPAWSGSKTPAWGGNAAAGRTPAWGADGNRTTYGGGEDGRTAYGGSTWNTGSRTPYGGSYGTTGGSATPHWSGQAPTPAFSGSKTPAYTPGAASAASPPATNNDSYRGAPTPAAFDAPTPGFSAPTPAANDQPTPRGYGGSGYGYGNYATPAAAPTPGAYPETPGAFPQTPGAWNAESPAASGGDDDPRYE